MKNKIKQLLWRFSMALLQWSYVHCLPERTHEVAQREGNERAYGFLICPERDRDTLHVLASAPPDHPYPDYTFWVKPVTEKDFAYYTPEGVEVGWFRATEVESGVSSFGPTAAEALANYWLGVEGGMLR